MTEQEIREALHRLNESLEKIEVPKGRGVRGRVSMWVLGRLLRRQARKLRDMEAE